MFKNSKNIELEYKDRDTSIDSRIEYASLLLFLIFLALEIRYQIKLSNYIEWGDESETIVASKMIASGQLLYSDIFNHHGPLTFLPGIIIEKFGNFGVRGHRLSIVILQIVALLSIYFSINLESKFSKRIYTVSAATFMLVYLPDIFGHTYMYQVIAGLLLVITLTQYSFISILNPNKLDSKRIFLGNFLITSLPFLAITYAPISILLFFSSLRKEHLKISVSALLFGVAANLAFLESIGTIRGYLAYHIYLNAKILPLYNGGQSGLQLIRNALQTSTGDMAHFGFLLATMYGGSILASRENSFPWRSILFSLGIGSLLIRGAGFHALPYYYALMAIASLFLFKRNFSSWQSKLIGLVLLTICLAKLSLLLPADREKIAMREIPTSSEFSRLVQLFTQKDDKIIAYSFQNFQYIAANRLPASGYFFYLPWQEKYNEKPILGISINACEQISAYRPKIMLIDKWKVWDRFPWDSYADCIQKLLDSHYVKLPNKPYYIRNDLIIDGINFRDEDIQRKLQPSQQISTSNSIQLIMPSELKSKSYRIKRVGVMFGTYARQNQGKAELRLLGSDGSEYRQQFSLSELADNEYRYFDLRVGNYTSGKITSLSGGGVSTWESHEKNGNILTCLIYEYEDGRYRFTPGCPFS